MELPSDIGDVFPEEFQKRVADTPMVGGNLQVLVAAKVARAAGAVQWYNQQLRVAAVWDHQVGYKKKIQRFLYDKFPNGTHLYRPWQCLRGKRSATQNSHRR
eukprot:3118556-Rhodomonas_salina.1